MTEDGMKKTAVDLLPPATLLAVIGFWYLAPQAWVAHWATMTGVLVAVTAFVLGMEFLFERHAGWRMNAQEFFTDVFYMVLNATVISKVSSLLADEPLMAAKHAWGIATPWLAHAPFLVQAMFVVFLIEFGQYWMHRLMHNSTPFWLTHAPHHHITQLNAMKGAVGNPIELFLISLSFVALFDVDPRALLCAFSCTLVISTYAHANVKADPPLFYSYIFTTIRHHSLHHSVPYEDTRCNYGNSVILFDRIFGTYKEGEASVVGQDERRRLTIREQFLFPFQPVIKWYKERQANSGTLA
jgi:sterol desaturase/sphingolipid hydroxylase (fatty acid hydroxylase superfamily)